MKVYKFNIEVEEDGQRITASAGELQGFEEFQKALEKVISTLPR